MDYVNYKVMCQLSIIVAAYNIEEYIDRCLYSIEPLSKHLDIEIIVINDGSTDRTEERIKHYIDRHQYVRLITQDNQGLSAVRNRGIEIATGDYVWFIDGDDYIDSAEFLRVFDYVSLGALYDVICFGRLEDYGSKRIKNPVIRSFRKYETGRLYLNDSISTGLYRTQVWDRLYRREFIMNHSIQFEEGLIYEDMLFSLQVFMDANSVAVIPVYPYYYIHYNPYSITKSIRSKDMDVLLFVDKSSRFIFEKNDMDEELIRSFNILIFTWVSSCLLNKYAYLSLYREDAKKIVEAVLMNEHFMQSVAYCRSHYCGMRKTLFANILSFSPLLFRISIAFSLFLRRLFLHL